MRIVKHIVAVVVVDVPLPSKTRRTNRKVALVLFIPIFSLLQFFFYCATVSVGSEPYILFLVFVQRNLKHKLDNGAKRVCNNASKSYLIVVE